MTNDDNITMNEYTPEQLANNAVVNGLRTQVSQLKRALQEVLNMYDKNEYKTALWVCEKEPKQIKAIKNACSLLLLHDGDD